MGFQMEVSPTVDYHHLEMNPVSLRFAQIVCSHHPPGYQEIGYFIFHPLEIFRFPWVFEIAGATAFLFSSSPHKHYFVTCTRTTVDLDIYLQIYFYINGDIIHKFQRLL